MSLEREVSTAVFVVLDDSGSYLSPTLDIDTALTVIALASEDPDCWAEAMDYWPRYRTPEVSEFASSLPFEKVDRESAIEGARRADAWVVLDFEAKRLLLGRGFMQVGTDCAMVMSGDESSNRQHPLSIHLPPWWEVNENVDASVIDVQRRTAICKLPMNREVLFGEPMCNDLAARMLATVRGEAWSASDAPENEQTRHEFTVKVHRDWLMTPRADLGGRIPRQLLHGAQDWIDRVIYGQRMRYEDGAPMIAVADDVADFATAPMGTEEMVIYFELCRELIQAGWLWCIQDIGQAVMEGGLDCHAELVSFFRDVKEDWLNSSFEGGSSPSFIIECSRRRVPRGVGVPILGMTQSQSEEHLLDCDCPICKMMAEGMFGTSFAALDGYQLDADDEFAFSTHETREAWEEMRLEYEEMSEAIACKRNSDSEANDLEPDEFASAWAGEASSGPLPGDPRGHLKLAFLLAEFISVLQSHGAPRAVIQEVNERFIDFRNCDSLQVDKSAERLKEVLQSLADQHPELVSKAADFQSRIDAQLRSAKQLDS